MSTAQKRIAFVVASSSRAVQLLSFLHEDAARAGFLVSVFCGDDVYQPLKDFFEKNNITRYPLVRVPQKSALAVFNHLRYCTLGDFKNKYREQFRRQDFATSGFFLPYVVWPISRILSLVPFFRKTTFWDGLEVRLFGNHPRYQEIFAQARFDWVAFPTPVLRSASELLLFTAAKKAGLKVTAVDEAFGQFVILPVSFRNFDRIFVWNKHTVNQAMQFHGLPEKAMAMSGPHRFDSYFKDVVPSREAFYAAHGLDAQKRIIGFVLSGVDIEFAIIDALSERIKKGEFRDVQVLVRPNPFMSKAEVYASRYAGVPGIVVSDPQAPVAYEGFTVLQSQMIDLGALLKYSAVNLSQASTVAIEGAIFNTPALYHLFGLDYVEESVTAGREARHQEAARREKYDEWPFIADVIATGAVPVARSMDELLQMIDDALASRSTLARERKLLVEKICTYTDGRSGERIMRALIES